MGDEISEVDLCAYVDDQLDAQRRVEVEDYLARHPEAAAMIMGDLRSRDQLRLAKCREVANEPRLVEAARLLDRSLRTVRLRRLVPQAFAILLVGTTAWLGQDEVGEFLIARGEAAPVPAFVSEAAETHEAALLRAEYEPRTLNPSIDGGRIKTATSIVFPRLPPSWAVRDVQFVPTDDGPGLQISVSSGRGVPLTFFAVKTNARAPGKPSIFTRSGSDVAYWRSGQFGYALTGSLSPADLDREAEDLADNPTE